MKIKFTRFQLGLIALGLGLAVLAMAYYLATVKGAGLVAPSLVPKAMTTDSFNPQTMNTSEAKSIIEQTEDKTTIPKAVWLASGLTEEEYKVIWKKGTERAGTSPLNNEKRAGTFVTKACGLPVFSSEHKYESGTGWPSFYEANKENIVLKEDYSWLGIKRIEVQSKCGEHLGHVFEDGPEPTGLRYCMNGAALEFVPAQN